MSEPPILLNDVARGFWDRHHERLRAAGLLTDADVESFTMLCVIWSKLAALSATVPGDEAFREMVQLNQLWKQFHTYAREFGLMPAARKRSKLNAEAPAETDRFGF